MNLTKGLMITSFSKKHQYNEDGGQNSLGIGSTKSQTLQQSWYKYGYDKTTYKHTPLMV